jgi:hypothetical protein
MVSRLDRLIGAFDIVQWVNLRETVIKQRVALTECSLQVLRLTEHRPCGVLPAYRRAIVLKYTLIMNTSAFFYDPFERPTFTAYVAEINLVSKLDRSGQDVLSQIRALEERLAHLCGTWWSGVHRDYVSMSRGLCGTYHPVQEQELKFSRLHEEFWQLETDRLMMISSLEHVYARRVSRFLWLHDDPGLLSDFECAAR